MTDLYQPDPENTIWIGPRTPEDYLKPQAPEPEEADDDYYGSFCGECHAELVGDEMVCPFCGEEFCFDDEDLL